MSFARACATTDVEPGTALAVSVEGVTVAVVREDDDWYAIYDECSHAAIPLSEGDVEGTEIECWLHGSRFDLRTGKPIGPPATEPVATFAVEIRNDDVFVDTYTTLNGVTPA
jgi:3-phenylpropionate/trans-cinnamate dioxygenase ferredoxin subunit